MNVNYRYIYEKKGAIVRNKLENDLWVDVGNASQDGVFDHHQNGGDRSAFACVMKNTNCYEGLSAYLASRHDTAEVVFHVHEDPDLDCLFGTFAIQRMIQRNRSNPAEAFDANVADTLLHYVNEIDSGRGKYMSAGTLYAYFCKIGEDIQDAQKRNQEFIDEGLVLLDLVVTQLENANSSIDLFKMPLHEYIDTSKLKYYSSLQESLQKAYTAYQTDKANNRVSLRLIHLWNTARNEMDQVKAAIWKELPSGEDEYIIARDEDECLLTVYPYEIREENSQDALTRVVIALNPNLPKAEEFSLVPLAEVIELCEQIEEGLLYEQTGRYRRDHSRPREDGRFSEIPFHETDDPWYFSEKGDLIDSPRVHSLIPYNRILSIIENNAFMTEGVKFVRYKEDERKVGIKEVDGYEEISFGELYKITRQRIGTLKEYQTIQHLFIYIKIDAAMIKYSNQWLKTCCLNMVGKSNSNACGNNILQIDYRTCLYTDPFVTILAVADKRNQTKDNLIDEDNLQASPICADLLKILQHMTELRGIGSNLTKITKDPNEMDRFNRQLVELNTEMEQDGLIVDPIEQEIYTFISDVLGIDVLKRSVMTSAQLLIDNAEQKETAEKAKRDNRIQAGLGLVTIFTVFSAFVDAFDYIAKWLPGSDGGWSDLEGHPIIYKVEVGAFLFVAFIGAVAAYNAVKALKYAKTSK